MSAVEGKADMAGPHPECPLLTQSQHSGHLQSPTSSGADSSEKPALKVNLGLADSAAQRRGGLHIAGS
jgi:hypothetical protein